MSGHAQATRASLDVGSSSVRYADSIDVTAFSLSPAFQVSGRRGYLTGAGTLAQTSGASTYSGALTAAASTWLRQPVSLEAGITAGGSSHSDGARTGQLLGSGRLYLASAGRGLWGGGAIGSTWDGGLWREVVQASAGAWLTSTPGTAMLSITPTAVDDTIRYTDASLVLQRESSRVDVAASLGTRMGDPLPMLITDRFWGSASAAFWLTPRTALVAAGGTYPIDFTQGYPGGRFASFALRIAAKRAAPLPSPSGARVTTTPPAIRSLEVAPAASGTRRIRVYAPGVSSVDVMGSFTSWSLLSLRPEGNGWWGATAPLGRGSHEITVRVNRGPWTVPPGLTILPQEFGGATGLLIVQ